MIPEGYRLVVAFPLTYSSTPNSPHEWSTVWEFKKGKYVDYNAGLVRSSNPYDFDNLLYRKSYLKFNEAMQHAKGNLGW